MQLDDVQKNYDRLAPIYDCGDRWLAGPLTRLGRLRRQTVAHAGLRPGDRALDVGCGTGLNLPLLVEAVGVEGSIVALDYSPGMLDRARARAARHGWSGVTFVRGDAARLPVEGSFDAVISTWALGIVHDLPAALRRAVEVLRPGGRLVVLDLQRSRAPSGLRRHVVDPVLHQLLRLSGVDAPEDLDDARLRERWARGRAWLREALVDVEEQTNVGGAGFLLSGRRPSDG